MGNGTPKDTPETLRRLSQLQQDNQKHSKLDIQKSKKIQQLQKNIQNNKLQRQINNRKQLQQIRKSLKNENKLQLQAKLLQARLKQQAKQREISYQQKVQIDKMKRQLQQIQRKKCQQNKELKNHIDKQLQKYKQQYQNQIKQLQKQLKSMNDPQKIKQHVARLKQIVWSDFKQRQYKLQKGKSVIFVGRTSVGKSSLINKLFKTNVPTSKGSCTKEISIVTTYGKAKYNNLISIFDCPGLDQHFDLIKDPYKIPKFMGSISDIYYLYDGFIQEDIVKTFMAMKKKVYLVRTKCDPDQTPEENQEVKSQDYSVLKKIGLQTKIYFTSKKGGEDNQKLLKDIMSIS